MRFRATFPKRVRTSFPILLGIGMLAVNLFVIAMVSLSLRHSRIQYRLQAETTARNLCQVLEQNLAGCERVLGPGHLRTLAARNNLANAYRDVGRATEAIPLLEQNLAGCERVLGRGHLRTLAAGSNLAAAYQAAGRAAEAIPLLEQSLAGCERILGPGHPRTLAARINLAAANQAAGRPG